MSSRLTAGKRPVVAIACDTAGGKTHRTIEELIEYVLWLRSQGDPRSVVFLAPEHKLTSEIAISLRTEIQRRKLINLVVGEYRGRGAPKPQARHAEDLMCERYDAVREGVALLAEIEKEICAKCPHRLQENGDGALRGDCAYQRQRHKRADIWVAAHATVTRAMPNCIAGEEGEGIALLVIDEDIVGACLSNPILMAADFFDDGVMPLPSNEKKAADLLRFRRAVAKIIRTAPEGWLHRDALAREGIDYLLATAAAEAELARKIGPKKEPNYLDRIDNRTVLDAHDLARAFADLVSPAAGLTGKDPISGQIFITRDPKTKQPVARIAKRTPIHTDWIAPALILDAMVYDAAALKELFPTVRFEGRIDIEAPYQRITQVVNRAYSKDWLSPKPEAGRDNCRKVAASIVREHLANLDEHPKDGPGSLVVCNKSVAKMLSGLLPTGLKIDIATYGRTAGRNEWSKVRNLFIVGRPLPEPKAVEMQAAAFFDRSVEPIEKDPKDPRRSTWYRPARAYRIRRRGNQMQKVACETFVHPDERAEFMRWRSCEAAVMQAIGRGRGSRRGPDDPLDVYVWTNVVLPCPVDQFVQAEDVDPTSHDLQIAAGGIAFDTDGAEIAARLYGEIWPTANAFDCALRHEREQRAKQPRLWTESAIIPSNPYIKIYREMTECSAKRSMSLAIGHLRFKLKGPKRHWVTAVWTPAICPDPRAVLDEAFEIAEIVVETPRDMQPVAAEPVVEPSVLAPEPPSVGRLFRVTISEGIYAQAMVSLDADVGEPILAGVWERLWRHAIACGMTETDVAQQLGISASHLESIESTRRKPPRWLEPAIEALIRSLSKQGRPYDEPEMTAWAL